jgi:hypothetical protein
VITTKEGRALLPGPSSIAEGGRMKTIVITYKGVVIKDPNHAHGKRAGAGDVVSVSDDDATLLIGMGRAKLYEPPKEPTKEPPKGDPEKEPEWDQEKETMKGLKKEAHSAPPRPERKKE